MLEHRNFKTTVNPIETGQATDRSDRESYDFGAGEILRYTPENIDANERAGQRVGPILYVQGMNGDDKLPHMLEYLAQHGQRQVIGVRYYDAVPGSPEPIKPGERGYRPDTTIPGLDLHRADDLLAALQVFDDVREVTVVAESAGAIPALLATDNLSGSTTTDSPPVTVRNVVLVDPAGQDGRSYRQTHADAIRQVFAEKRDVKRRYRLGEAALEMIADTPEISAFAKQRRDRPVQKAVAHAQGQALLADIAQRVPVTVLSDVSDKAFRTERIAEQMQLSGASGHVELIRTDKGGHGVGLNKTALDTVITVLRQLEAPHEPAYQIHEPKYE